MEVGFACILAHATISQRFRRNKMARSKAVGNGRLEEAIAILLQNQATFVQSQTAFLARMAETDAHIAETNRINSERFARIEGLLVEHNRILSEHTLILQALTDAIREKIGFKLPEPK
ncbi:MAG: hypothetical protein L0Y72_30395 [Gemmataceae bacterium]|nr:hypothetical protein [Gemmataceae bacterium]MCI0743358.1 hypothetical protein [Gemmataceae bacterium]